MEIAMLPPQIHRLLSTMTFALTLAGGAPIDHKALASITATLTAQPAHGSIFTMISSFICAGMAT
jgi:hypothetical protein